VLLRSFALALALLALAREGHRPVVHSGEPWAWQPGHAAFGLECLALQKSSASPSKRSALDSLSDLDRERGSLDARVTLTAYWILPRHALYRLRSIYGYTRSVYGIL
jgi:hypothetical protein